MTEFESEYRALLAWALKETALRVPEALRDPGVWTFDEGERETRFWSGCGPDRWEFWSEVTTGRQRTETAFLRVEGDGGSATWESPIPADVLAAAKRANV
mgnify:CR=1 FL=1